MNTLHPLPSPGPFAPDAAARPPIGTHRFGRRHWPALGLLGAWMLTAGAVGAESIHNAPPLPEPAGRVVRVDTPRTLVLAIQAARSDTTIVIEPGEYRLQQTPYLTGPARNVTIRGATDNPLDVQIVGPGMRARPTGAVRHGLLLGNVQNVTIANLTIRDMPQHAIAMQAQDGCRAPRIYNCALVDTGQQHIKANPAPDGTGVDGGIVEYTALAYTTTAKDWYTNGIDIHAGRNWIIRHCFFRNFKTPPADRRLAGPAVLVWSGAADTIVEGCYFYDCDTAIAFGRDGPQRPEHRGGIIRNNFIFRTAGTSGDAGITLWNSPGTRVLHNTIILNGTYPTAIDLRYASTRDVQVAHNLTDARIAPRDGAEAESAGNVLDPRPEWFVDLARGNLRLTRQATAAIDAVEPLDEVSHDYDGTRRPIGPRADAGAHEYQP